MLRITAPLAVIGLTASAALYITAAAQNTARKQSFEAASLKREDPNSAVNYNGPTPPRTFPNNRISYRHTLLKSLIADAYGVEYLKISGGPAWLDSEHYDLDAKAEGNARLTLKEMQPMLRAVLEERLHLAVHHVSRVVPGYALAVAKDGARLRANNGAPFGGSRGADELKFQQITMQSFAQTLSGAIKQPVVDETALAGTFDIDLKFAPEDATTDAPNYKYGHIFSAIQDQLGLKLIARKLPVDYLVIDRVDRVPSQN
jgi:uncharacterized protein (TIGR03435 family)